MAIEDITTDFSDGIKLIQLIEILSGQPCTAHYNKAPKLAIQKTENVSIALAFLNRFTKVSIDPQGMPSISHC
jgi:hypothetical protein